MSGHSKWANIKRKKEANDKVKGSVFSKLSRLITLAVVEGGGMADPDLNVKLRLMVEKAKAANMPKENIKRAIEKASGPNKQLIKEIIYEAFAPLQVSLMILATSDNLNRTFSEVRNLLEMNGGKMGNQGSVAYLFQKCGLVIFKKSDVSEENIFNFSDRIGALDIDQNSEYFFVYFPFEKLGKIKEIAGELKYESAEIDYKPLTTVAINEESQVQRIINLIDSLEALDDVHKVFANFDFNENTITKD